LAIEKPALRILEWPPKLLLMADGTTPQNTPSSTMGIDVTIYRSVGQDDQSKSHQ